MNELPLAPATQRAVDIFVASPGSVLILYGPEGVGKRQLAEQILANILGIVQEKLISYPYLIEVEPDGSSISIEAIRQLQSALVRRVPGDTPIRRAILIQAADTLTLEAQNALLKSLEEPPADTVFVLCASSLSALLPTVVSRAQKFEVLSVSEKAAREYFEDRFPEEQIKRTFLMSDGRIALMEALLTDEEHPLVAAIQEAKTILQKSSYERLLLVNDIAKDKLATNDLLDALLLLARTSVKTSAKAGKTAQAKQWQAMLKHITFAKDALAQNAGAKIVLTDLFLQV